MRLSLKPDPRADLAFTFNYYDLDADLPGPLSDKGFREDFRKSETPFDHWETTRFAANLSLKLALSEASKITASLYGNHFDRTFFGTTGFRINPKVVGGDLSHTLTAKLLGRDQTLVTGLKLEAARRDLLGFRPSRPGGLTGTTTSQTLVEDFLVAPYFQTTLTLVEPLTLTGGLRFESLEVRNTDRFNNRRNNKTFDELVWSVGVTYRAIERLTFYGNIQRTFEVPTRQAFGTAFAGIAFGVETADAQTAIQYDLGVRTQPTDWLSLDLTFFRFDFSNLPVITAGVVESIGESRHQGIEARIDVGLARVAEALVGAPLPALTGLGVFANLAFLDAEITRFKTFSGNRVPYSPEFSAGWGLSYRHPTGFGGSIEGQFTDDQFSDPENTRPGSADGQRGIVPSRTVWNLNLQYDIPRRLVGVEGASAFFSIRNLFDNRYIDTRVSGAGFGIWPGLPQTFSGGLSFKF